MESLQSAVAKDLPVVFEPVFASPLAEVAGGLRDGAVNKPPAEVTRQDLHG
ncbi:MAG: hypothetical protein ACREOV_12580 [Candidatus Dormibacteraceae bacterium]